MTKKNKDTATNQSKDGKNTKSKIINLPHDALAKHLLENKSNAIDFLNEYLPQNFKDKIDLSTLEMDKETFIEKHLVRRASDVLYNSPYAKSGKKQVNVVEEIYQNKLKFKNGSQYIGYIFRLFNMSKQVCYSYRFI